MSFIPSSWSTPRYTIDDARLEDVDELHDVALSCSHIAAWDQSFRPEPREGTESLVRESIRGASESDRHFKLQVVRPRADERIAAYFHFMHGVPHPTSTFLSYFVVRPERQGDGLGGEIIEAFTDGLRRLGYNTIWLEVYLKNWPALRFWASHGFTTINEWRGDEQISDDGHARLILSRDLVGPMRDHRCRHTMEGGVEVEKRRE